MKRSQVLLVFVLGFLMGAACYAQSSCSHTITIRIIQPNTFEVTSPQFVEPETQTLNLEEEGGISTLKWKTYSGSKKITVSAPSADLVSLQLQTQTQDKPVSFEVTDAPRELLITEPGSAGQLDVRYVPVLSTDMQKIDAYPVIAYTITDAT